MRRLSRTRPRRSLQPFLEVETCRRERSIRRGMRAGAHDPVRRGRTRRTSGRTTPDRTHAASMNRNVCWNETNGTATSVTSTQVLHPAGDGISDGDRLRAGPLLPPAKCRISRLEHEMAAAAETGMSTGQRDRPRPVADKDLCDVARHRHHIDSHRRECGCIAEQPDDPVGAGLRSSDVERSLRWVNTGHGEPACRESTGERAGAAADVEHGAVEHGASTEPLRPWTTNTHTSGADHPSSDPVGRVGIEPTTQGL